MALSLKYVLLGMVAERPAYGYELQRRLNERLPFANYTAGAVYPALNRLESDLWIVVTGKKGGGTVRANPRLMYAPTPQGLTNLEQWMYTPTPPEADSRDTLLGKLAVARPQDLPRLLELASGQEALLRRQLGELMEVPALEWSGRGRVPLTIVGATLARTAQARRLSAAIESLQEIREALEHELRGAPSPRRR